MKKIIYILLSSYLCICYSQAGEVKIRAREHYEILNIKTQSVESKYQGFSNTINVWWEKPYDFSLGLSFSPILSNLKEKKDNSIFGKKIKIIHFGIEAKVFETSTFDNFYLRPGLSYSILKTDLQIPNKTGFSTYLGLGYEIPFKKFGLAIEAAYRFSQLEDDITIDTITPSVGLHFYKAL